MTLLISVAAKKRSAREVDDDEDCEEGPSTKIPRLIPRDEDVVRQIRKLREDSARQFDLMMTQIVPLLTQIGDILLLAHPEAQPIYEPELTEQRMATMGPQDSLPHETDLWRGPVPDIDWITKNKMRRMEKEKAKEKEERKKRKESRKGKDRMEGERPDED